MLFTYIIPVINFPILIHLYCSHLHTSLLLSLHLIIIHPLHGPPARAKTPTYFAAHPSAPPPTAPHVHQPPQPESPYTNNYENPNETDITKKGVGGMGAAFR